jgi:hypothetical protein
MPSTGIGIAHNDSAKGAVEPARLNLNRKICWHPANQRVLEFFRKIIRFFSNSGFFD